MCVTVNSAVGFDKEHGPPSSHDQNPSADPSETVGAALTGSGAHVFAGSTTVRSQRRHRRLAPSPLHCVVSVVSTKGNTSVYTCPCSCLPMLLGCYG